MWEDTDHDLDLERLISRPRSFYSRLESKKDQGWGEVRDRVMTTSREGQEWGRRQRRWF